MTDREKIAAIVNACATDDPPRRVLDRIRDILRNHHRGQRGPYNVAGISRDVQAYRRAYRERRIAAGLCLRCGCPNDQLPKRRCSKCAPGVMLRIKPFTAPTA